MLFGKLLPREGNFFELFNQHGNHIAEGARAFIRLIQHYADPALVVPCSRFQTELSPRVSTKARCRASSSGCRRDGNASGRGLAATAFISRTKPGRAVAGKG